MVSKIVFAFAICWLVAPLSAANFVSGNDQDSQRIVELAEQYRRDIAIAWLGEELPDWPAPCQITWRVDGQPSNGLTTFTPTGWPQNASMQINGKDWRELVQDSLPHEVFHLVFYDHLEFRIPRWMDEGAATTCESDQLITNHERQLLQFFNEGRVPPINVLMLEKDYPADVAPFYATGSSLSRWLVNRGGPERFIQLAKMQRDHSWSASVREIYGFPSLRAMQSAWVDWVSRGSPELAMSMKPIPRAQAPFRPVMSQCSRSDGQCSAPPSQQPVNIQIDYAKVADILFQKYGDQLKGDRGPKGDVGPQGGQGPQGKQGEPGESADPSKVPSGNRRVIVVNGSDRTVIDDETYGPDEPIVLDVQNIVNAAGQK